MTKRYVLDYTVRPPICLPAELDRSRLEDVTPVDDASWRVYREIDTGKVHDGIVHFWDFKCARLGVLMGWRKPEDGAEADLAGGVLPTGRYA